LHRLFEIADEMNSNAMERRVNGATPDPSLREAATSEARSNLRSLDSQIDQLDIMLEYKPHLTEFLLVTVPTELASKEILDVIIELAYATCEPYSFYNLIVNQVLGLNEDDADFLEYVGCQQTKIAVTDVEQLASSLASPPRITKTHYLDTEPRGTFGLQAMADELLKYDPMKCSPA
jgi:anion-transporting  ArsA/GET3 family ATPase